MRLRHLRGSAGFAVVSGAAPGLWPSLLGACRQRAEGLYGCVAPGGRSLVEMEPPTGGDEVQNPLRSGGPKVVLIVGLQKLKREAFKAWGLLLFGWDPRKS